MDDHIYFSLSTSLLLSVVFWSCQAYYYTLRCLPLFDRFKIAKNANVKPPPQHLVNECFRDQCLGQLLRPLLLYLTWPIFQAIRPFEFEAEKAETGGVFACKVLGCMLVDDTLFYWAHRLLHHRWLYKRIHKKHHAFRYAMPMAVEYSHPLEDIFGNTVPTIAGPILLSSHVYLLWFYTAMKLYQSIDAHSGYDLPFPLSPWSFVKYMDCAPAHDYHHSHNVGNYGGYFIFWDWICGTDQSYVRYVEKQKEKQALMQKANLAR